MKDNAAENIAYPPVTNTDAEHGSPKRRYLDETDTAPATSGNPYVYDITRSPVPVSKRS